MTQVFAISIRATTRLISAASSFLPLFTSAFAMTVRSGAEGGIFFRSSDQRRKAMFCLGTLGTWEQAMSNRRKALSFDDAAMFPSESVVLGTWEQKGAIPMQENPRACGHPVPPPVDAQAIQQELASMARSLANALPVDGATDLGGAVMTPEAIAAAAKAARSYLGMIADLMGGDGDPDWQELPFVAIVKKRPGWKPPVERTSAEMTRETAAVRVYELMAEQFLDTGRAPKQEAAVASVMDEFQLARSKVMQGLKELRARSVVTATLFAEPGADPPVMSEQDELKRSHWWLARKSLLAAWLKRNIGDRNIDDSSVTGRT